RTFADWKFVPSQDCGDVQIRRRPHRKRIDLPRLRESTKTIGYCRSSLDRVHVLAVAHCGCRFGKRPAYKYRSTHQSGGAPEINYACACSARRFAAGWSGRKSASTPCTVELSPMSLLVPGLRIFTLAPFGSSFGQRPLCTSAIPGGT